jgi:hypothetical protein
MRGVDFAHELVDEFVARRERREQLDVRRGELPGPSPSAFDQPFNDMLGPRRPRTSVRKVKSPLSRYNKKDPHRPERATPITAIEVTIHEPGTPRPATRRSQCLTTAPEP